MIYGKGSSFVLIDLGNLNPSDGYSIYGVSSSDALGLSVSGAGINFILNLFVRNVKFFVEQVTSMAMDSVMS